MTNKKILLPLFSSLLTPHSPLLDIHRHGYNLIALRDVYSGGATLSDSWMRIGS